MESSELIPRAFKLLVFKHGLKPGVKGKVLRQSLGKEYTKVLDILAKNLEDLKLELKYIDEGKGIDNRRYFIVSKEPFSEKEAKLIGWDKRYLAALIMIILYLISRNGRAPEKDVKTLLERKGISHRKIDAFIKSGYLSRKSKTISIGWRAKVEIDQEKLYQLFMSCENI